MDCTYGYNVLVWESGTLEMMSHEKGKNFVQNFYELMYHLWGKEVYASGYYFTKYFHYYLVYQRELNPAAQPTKGYR